MKNLNDVLSAIADRVEEFRVSPEPADQAVAKALREVSAQIREVLDGVSVPRLAERDVAIPESADDRSFIQVSSGSMDYIDKLVRDGSFKDRSSVLSRALQCLDEHQASWKNALLAVDEGAVPVLRDDDGSPLHGFSGSVEDLHFTDVGSDGSVDPQFSFVTDPVDVKYLAEFWIGLGNSLRISMAHEPALASYLWADQLIMDSQGEGLDPVSNEVLLRKGDVRRRMGDLGAAQDAYSDAKIGAVEKEDHHVLADANECLGDVLRLNGKGEEAVAQYVRALEWYEDADNVIGVVNASLGAADALLGLGKFDAARERFEYALSRSRSRGYAQGEGNAELGLASVALLFGQVEPAKEHLFRALSLFSRTGDSLGGLNARAIEAEIRFAQGERGADLLMAAVSYGFDLIGIPVNKALSEARSFQMKGDLPGVSPEMDAKAFICAPRESCKGVWHVRGQ